MSSRIPDLGLDQFGVTWNDTRQITADRWAFLSHQLERLRRPQSAEDRQRVLDDVDEVRNEEKAVLRKLAIPLGSSTEAYIKVLSLVFFSTKAIGYGPAADSKNVEFDGKRAISCKNAERNKWCFEQYRHRPDDKIPVLRAEAKQHGWTINNDPAFRKAKKAHCKIHQIDIPRRNNRRTKPKSTLPTFKRV